MPNHARGTLGRILLIVGRLALAAVFLFAAYMKIKPPQGMHWSPATLKTSLAMFAMEVDSYEMLSPPQVNLVAHVLPFVELALGIWLLTGVGLRFSSLATTLLLAGFIAAMFSAYERGLTISCGCFGPGEQVGPKRLVEDGLLFLPIAIAVAVGAFVVHRRTRARTPKSNATSA
ncbi:MAG TPA: MauE/DoxX family redox-associated membrane protein [Candidatus Acidoferrales bacterium]|nr:MauE/DoxX family redox-associated membrane protein [Candidatus Acidoferrales bacterium]